MSLSSVGISSVIYLTNPIVEYTTNSFYTKSNIKYIFVFIHIITYQFRVLSFQSHTCSKTATNVWEFSLGG